MCKKAGFYIKRQLSYHNIFCKKTATLQKYISVKKSFFTTVQFVKKKTGLLHKKAAFLQKYISVKKQFFYNRSICKKVRFLHKKAAFLQNIFL